MIDVQRILSRPDTTDGARRHILSTRPMDIPIVVFSDVDAVLRRPQTHSCAEAANLLKRLRGEGVLLVLSSSKTRAEIEAIQEELGIHHPFVCESGAAAIVPAWYFGFSVPSARDRAGYQIIEFGRPYWEVVQALHRTAARARIQIVGFNDMSVEEVARECQMSLPQAQLAKSREYSERFRILGSSKTTRRRLVRALRASRLRCVAGEQYDHVGADVGKDRGVDVLWRLYQRAYGAVLTVGVQSTPTDDHVPKFVHRRVRVMEADSAAGDVDVVAWAATILDIVKELRRAERTAMLATASDDYS